MRKISILALLLVVFPTPASEAITLTEAVDKRSFNLDEHSRRATHILVVDACGKILDVWKGTSKVGDFISLDTVLSPTFPRMTDTQQSPFNWLTDSQSYISGMVGRRNCMILFLVQAPSASPADLQAYRTREIEIGFRTFAPRFPLVEQSDFGALVVGRVADVIGIPRESVNLDGWSGKCPIPRTPLRWSACTMAFVDDLRYVHSQGWGSIPNYRHRQWDKIILEWQVIGTDADVQRKVWEANHQTRSLD